MIIPNEVMEMNCLLPYNGEAYFYGSLAEPMSCIVGAYHAQYHTKSGSYVHEMEIVDGGNMAILAGAGPMGLGAIDYAINREDRRPKLLVVTDIDQARLDRAASIYTVEAAAKNGIELHYINTNSIDNPTEHIMALSGGRGYDDVFVYAPVRPVIEMGDQLLARDGCLNFFAGPTNPDFKAEFNFYNVHYNSTHIVGTSGGNTDDMIESLELMEKGIINPAAMITHIGGLDSVVETTLNTLGVKTSLHKHSNGINLIDDFMKKAKPIRSFAKLAEIVAANNGLWCLEAEKYLLENAKKI